MWRAMSSAVISANDPMPNLGASAAGQDGPARVSTLYLGARILVVDDDPLNQEIAGRMLRKFGCSTETAVNGEVAVQR